MRKYLIVLFVFMFFCFFRQDIVKGYENVCENEILTQKGAYKLCENPVYINKEKKENSSYLLADRDGAFNSGKILYIGKVDNIDTFYSTGFNYMSVVYDDRGTFSSDKNIWSDISIDGVVVYNSYFEDNAFIDESSRRYTGFYNEIGTYLIRQFIGNDLDSYIKVIVVSKDDVEVYVDNVMLGDSIIDSSNLVYGDNDLKFFIAGDKYGYGKFVDISVNECNFKREFSTQLIIHSNDFISCLKLNDTNITSIIIRDGLDRDVSFKYRFNLSSNSVSIKLEDSVSKVVTSSRRILIKASAGVNNKLDENFCLYYWSSNPNDKLTYDDFMSNYENSKNKGTYVSNKGVILRDEDGEYYLYALAKDDVSSVVVRSDKYILKKTGDLNRIIWSDVWLVIFFVICASIPIVVYLIVRGKDTY